MRFLVLASALFFGPAQEYSKEDSRVAKFVFVTGGVVSSLGKGITAASLGRLLKSRGGVKVSMLKFDPYINMDPGTMSPYQHGEVFVLDDGGPNVTWTLVTTNASSTKALLASATSQPVRFTAP